MIFLHEELLWLTAFPLFLALFLISKKRRKMLSVFSPEIYSKLSQNKRAMPQGIRLTLFVLALILMIIALAQPVIEKEKIKLNQKAIDIIVAMDISRSMEAKDLFPSRLEWSKKKLLEFINMTEVLRIGVMAFAQSAYVVTPITEDKDVANYLVENLDTTNITENGTNLIQLLDTCNQQLENSLHKYLLLISDGGDNESFEKEIAFAKENKLTVFILSTATEKGAPIEDAQGNFLKKDGKIILTRLNRKFKNLALQTGGVYIQSIASDEDIRTMLGEIKNIAQAKTVDSKEIRSFVEYFAYFLAAALGLLFFAFHSLPQRKLASLLLLFALFNGDTLKAGIMDFKTIEEAQTAFESKDYKKAQSRFESLQKNSPTDATNYNLANTLYKQKNYKEALNKYKAISDQSNFKQQALHNLGNTYAQNKQLDEAIKAYEDALEISEDKQTRENLEAVKKVKEQQEKKDQKKNDKDKEKKDDKKDKDKNDKNSKDKKNSKDQKKQEKNDKKSSKNDKKEEKKKKTDKKDKNKPKKDDKSKKEKEKAKKEKLSQTPMKRSQKDLTDKEEKKLLKQLQMQKGQTFRYKIPSKFQKEGLNDKPW